MGPIPYRLNEFRAKTQFLTFAKMPGLITRAAKQRGYLSNTEYIQHVLCEALSRELGLDLAELEAQLPPPQAHFRKKQ